MVSVICAIRDSALNAFMRPFFVPAVGGAVRSFGDEVLRNAPDNVMFFHPEDYELFELGSFDDSNARFTMLPEPRSIGRGKDFIKE